MGITHQGDSHQGTTVGGVEQSTGYRAVVVCHESGHRKLRRT